MSYDDLKLLSEQISARVEAETSEAFNRNEMLTLELQQKDQEIDKVSEWLATHSGIINY